MKIIKVKENSVFVKTINSENYVSLTDIARISNKKEPKDVIKNWMRNRSSLEFLGLWEKLNNINFKGVDFEPLLSESGRNSFTMSPTKWINKFNAIGMVCNPKRNGGTFANIDIALEFASWISPEIKLYIIKEFQRLKDEEAKKCEWNNYRLHSKLNYLLQTNAIKENLILVNLTEEQKSLVYANEADIINVALFGITAKDFELKNVNKKGNLRDYASIIELSILSNLEFYNSKLIENKISQNNRLILLNKEANKEKEIF